MPSQAGDERGELDRCGLGSTNRFSTLAQQRTIATKLQERIGSEEATMKRVAENASTPLLRRRNRRNS